MADEISDPEARGVAERAHKTLLRVGAEGQATAPKPASKEVWHRERSGGPRHRGDALQAGTLAAQARRHTGLTTCICEAQEVLATLKECVKAHSKAVISAADEPMLQYVSVQAARLIDVKVFTPSEWSSKVLCSVDRGNVELLRRARVS